MPPNTARALQGARFLANSRRQRQDLLDRFTQQVGSGITQGVGNFLQGRQIAQNQAFQTGMQGARFAAQRGLQQAGQDFARDQATTLFNRQRDVARESIEGLPGTVQTLRRNAPGMDVQVGISPQGATAQTSVPRTPRAEGPTLSLEEALEFQRQEEQQGRRVRLERLGPNPETGVEEARVSSTTVAGGSGAGRGKLRDRVDPAFLGTLSNAVRDAIPAALPQGSSITEDLIDAGALLYEAAARRAANEGRPLDPGVVENIIAKQRELATKQSTRFSNNLREVAEAAGIPLPALLARIGIGAQPGVLGQIQGGATATTTSSAQQAVQRAIDTIGQDIARVEVRGDRAFLQELQQQQAQLRDALTQLRRGADANQVLAPLSEIMLRAGIDLGDVTGRGAPGGR